MKKHKAGFFFYTDDWRGDEALAMCSEGARLLWLEMLLLMNKAGGYFLINGRQPTPEQTAGVTRTDPNQVCERLAELRENGVCGVTKAGVIFSRKMVRDEEKSKKSRKNGVLGGNPTLCKTTEKKPSVNLDVNPEVKPLNPSLNLNQEERKKEGEVTITPQTPKPRATASVAGGFERFWSVYPRRIGKGDARRSFERALRKTTLDNLLEKTRLYAEHAAASGKEQQFIPHPATWLNQERWLDDLSAEPLFHDAQPQRKRRLSKYEELMVFVEKERQNEERVGNDNTDEAHGVSLDLPLLRR